MIIAVLAKYNLPMVGVKIVRDDIVQYARPHLSSLALQNVARPGQNIGFRGYGWWIWDFGRMGLVVESGVWTVVYFCFDLLSCCVAA